LNYRILKIWNIVVIIVSGRPIVNITMTHYRKYRKQQLPFPSEDWVAFTEIWRTMIGHRSAKPRQAATFLKEGPGVDFRNGQ